MWRKWIGVRLMSTCYSIITWYTTLVSNCSLFPCLWLFWTFMVTCIELLRSTCALKVGGEVFLFFCVCKIDRAWWISLKFLDELFLLWAPITVHPHPVEVRLRWWSFGHEWITIFWKKNIHMYISPHFPIEQCSSATYLRPSI